MSVKKSGKMKKESSVAGFNKLDIQVRVHIIEVRDLIGKDKNGMSDPVCVVNCNGSKQTTSIQKSTLNCTWDHLMFFDFKMFEDEFNQAKLNISVFDANTITRNELIGGYEFGFNTVNQQKDPNHEFYRTWVGLSDTEAKHPGIQGYLKLSVTVLKPGDQVAVHGEDEEDEDDDGGNDLASMVLLPPDINVKTYHLAIRIGRAEGLPKMDSIGKCDGFIKASFAGTTLKTQVIKKSYDPVWNEILLIPVTEPTMTDLIKIEVFDWDKVGVNELIATEYFSLKNVMKKSENGGKMGPFWKCLYGADPKQSGAVGIGKGKVKTYMNKGLIEGNTFLGRVLLELQLSEKANALAGVVAGSAIGEPKVEPYVFRLYMYEAHELNTNNKVYIQINIGKEEVKSKKVSVKHNTGSWYTCFELDPKLQGEIDHLPDVYIYLFTSSVSGKSLKGFLRYKALDLLKMSESGVYLPQPGEDVVSGPENAPNWIFMKEDPLKELDDDGKRIPPVLLFNLEFGRPNDVGKKKNMMDPPVLQNYQLRIHLYQARNLKGTDASGLSDPFVRVQIGRFRAKSKVVPETCFPVWYKTLTIDCSLPKNLQLAPDININVFDKDKILPDTLIGRTRFTTSNLTSKQTDPEWQDLSLGTEPAGQILVSFQLLDENEASSNILPITPKMKDCTLQIGAVGLRDLLPFRLRKIQSALIEMDYGDRKNKEKIFKTQSSHSPSGTNPNHLQVFNIPMKIPKDPIFAPSLNIRVHETKVLGDPVFGVCSIPLHEYIPWERKKKDPKKRNLPKALPEDWELHNPVPKKEVEKPEIEIDETPNSDLIEVSDFDTPEPPRARKGIKGKLGGITKMGKSNVNEKTTLLEDDALAQQEYEDSYTVRTLASAPDQNLPGDDSNLDEDESEEEDPSEKRPAVAKELEFEIDDVPFDEFELERGESQASQMFKSLFQSVSGGGVSASTSTTVVGSFKGSIQFFEGKVEPLDLREMYTEQGYVIRVYIIRGINVVPMDASGLSDPYLKLKWGDKKDNKINDKQNKQMETLNPEFYKCYEFNANLPGLNSNLTIEMYDWDAVGQDDLIGITEIDLENRIYSNKWQSYNKKPIEYRTLWNPASLAPQGQLEMWIDIMTPEEAMRIPQEVIEPPQPMMFELRVVLWECKEVVFKDKKMSDIFYKAMLEGGKKQESDVHYRSEDGKGSFNWRYVYEVELPCKVPRFKLQCWDKDLITPNDVIAELNLNLKGFFKKAYKKKSAQYLKKTWLNLLHPNFDGIQGKVLIEFALLPLEDARARPVGLGRKEPNTDPFLPEPDRPDTSFNPFSNPFKYMQNVYWRKHKTKVYACACCCCCLIILVGLIMAYSYLSPFL